MYMHNAVEVVGIDNDPIAIESAHEVAKSNQQQVTLRYQENDDYQSSDETYDYILANVNKNTFIQTLSHYWKILTPPKEKCF